MTGSELSQDPIDPVLARMDFLRVPAQLSHSRLSTSARALLAQYLRLARCCSLPVHPLKHPIRLSSWTADAQIANPPARGGKVPSIPPPGTRYAIDRILTDGNRLMADREGRAAWVNSGGGMEDIRAAVLPRGDPSCGADLISSMGNLWWPVDHKSFPVGTLRRSRARRRAG